MTDVKSLPAAKHQTTLTLKKKYNKVFSVGLKIFNTDHDLNEYFDKIVKARCRDTSGVWAGAIFDTPNKDNNYLLGDMVFSLENLHPGLVAHEATHIVFSMISKTAGISRLTNSPTEENFCILVEGIVDGVYQFLNANSIPFTVLPKY